MSTGKQLRRTARGVLVAGFAGIELPETLREDPPGGYILFRRNFQSLEQAFELTRLLHRHSNGGGPFVSVDQEGGRVTRLDPPVIEVPPMRRLGELDDPELTQAVGRELGLQLRALGFTCDYAPVLDVDTNPENPVIGDRSFGRLPELVSRHGTALADGLSQAGVIPTAKHFPGHGDTDTDSHLDLPRLSHDRARLDRVELAPFRAALDIPMWMSAHVVFDVLDSQTPATLSHRVITELVRGELGYRGVLVSDDLEMKAISDRVGIPDAACLAIEAGCDAVLICSDVTALEQATEALTHKADRAPTFAARLREAAKRFNALKRRFPAQPAHDMAEVMRILQSNSANQLQAELQRRMT